MPADKRRAGGKKRAREILERLGREYPDAGTRLVFSGPYQALVSIMLSAQTNDNQVNAITPAFFARFPDPCTLAAAPVEEVEELIRSVGLFRTKAANLVATARILCQEHRGEVPDDFTTLIGLPGVGRKTANVLLAVAFGKPGLGVDTHVHRVAGRLGLVASRQPEGTEKQLKALIPEAEWGKAHHLLIFHGRQVCHARKPGCPSCLLADLCPYPSRGPDDQK